MARKTQGTQLYTVDPDSDELITVQCALSIDGLGGSAGEIDVTCLESEFIEVDQGLKDSGTLTFELNFDPQLASHRRLKELYGDGSRLPWTIGLQGSSDAPTVASGKFSFPTSRDFFEFEGHLQNFTIGFQQKATVKASFGIRVSGSIAIHVAST